MSSRKVGVVKVGGDTTVGVSIHAMGKDRAIFVVVEVALVQQIDKGRECDNLRCELQVRIVYEIWEVECARACFVTTRLVYSTKLTKDGNFVE